MQIEFSLTTHNAFRSFPFSIFVFSLCWLFTKREEPDRMLTRDDTKGLIAIVTGETSLLKKTAVHSTGTFCYKQ